MPQFFPDRRAHLKGDAHLQAVDPYPFVRVRLRALHFGEIVSAAQGPKFEAPACAKLLLPRQPFCANGLQVTKERVNRQRLFQGGIMFGNAAAGDRRTAALAIRIDEARRLAPVASGPVLRTAVSDSAQIVVQPPQEVDQHFALVAAQAGQKPALAIERGDDDLVMRSAPLCRQRDRVGAAVVRVELEPRSNPALASPPKYGSPGPC